MLERILEMKVRCNPYWSTAMCARASARESTAMCARSVHASVRTWVHSDVRAKRAHRRGPVWAGGWVGCFSKSPVTFWLPVQPW